MSGNQSNKIFSIVKTKHEAKKKWTKEEDNFLLSEVRKYKGRQLKWKEISLVIKRSANKCYSRFRQINPNLKKGCWSDEEEHQLLYLLSKHGKKWSLIEKEMKSRSGKQIRHHYLNVIDQSSNRDPFTSEEDAKIIVLYKKFGCKWKQISSFFENRTSDSIKSRFYNKIKRIIIKEKISNVLGISFGSENKPTYNSNHESSNLVSCQPSPTLSENDCDMVSNNRISYFKEEQKVVSKSNNTNKKPTSNKVSRIKIKKPKKELFKVIHEAKKILVVNTNNNMNLETSSNFDLINHFFSTDSLLNDTDEDFVKFEFTNTGGICSSLKLENYQNEYEKFFNNPNFDPFKCDN